MNITITPHLHTNKNLYSYSTSPLKSQAMSFRGEYTPENMSKDLTNIIESKLTDKTKLKKIDEILAKIENLPATKQSKFLLDANFSAGSIFDFALQSEPFFADKIWDFVKTHTNPDIQGAFLLGEFGWPEDTAYYRAIANHSAIAEDILDFTLNQTDKRITRRFFTMRTQEGLSISDQIAELGLTELAEELAEYEKEYSNNQETALQTGGKSSNSNFRVLDNVKTRLSDIGGMTIVKEQIKNELLAILNNPKVKNSDKPGGIILFGPPGTGKTLLATAIAGEAGVPFISTEGSSFAEIYVGAGPKNVRELYATARNLAKRHPSKTAIVFIDEVDAVGGKRGRENDSERQNTLNALLTEMDGVREKEEGDIKIITIMATNRKDMLDSAFRKGRIDMEFKIDNPSFNEQARYEILNIHAKDKPFRSEEEKEELLTNMANITRGFSGAELADIIKRAYRKTLYLGRENTFITKDDLYRAKIESRYGVENDCEIPEQEQKSTIAHEAGHAINLVILEKAFETEKELYKKPFCSLDLILNEPHSDAAAITIGKYTKENPGRYTIESLLCLLAYGYGGYSAEECIYQCHTDGVAADLEANTNSILTGVMNFGLGSRTKYLGLTPEGSVYTLYKNDIKEDLEKYATTGMKIANHICFFAAPFIEEYAENTYKSKSTITYGQEFIEMFNKWIKKTHKEAELEQLIQHIRKTISNFKEEMAQ